MYSINSAELLINRVVKRGSEPKFGGTRVKLDELIQESYIYPCLHGGHHWRSGEFMRIVGVGGFHRYV